MILHRMDIQITNLNEAYIATRSPAYYFPTQEAYTKEIINLPLLAFRAWRRQIHAIKLLIIIWEIDIAGLPLA